MTVRLHNPQKNLGPRRKRPGTRKTNPAELITLGFLNPQKGTSMTKKKKKKPAARRPNPFQPKAGKAGRPFNKGFRPKNRRKPNPTLGPLSKGVDFLKLGLFALIGLVLTRQLPQVALKQKNAGVFGYFANGVTAAGVGYGASKFISKPAGAAVAIGGGLYLVNRILSEQLSPIGQYLALAGTGDAVAAPHVGRLKEAYFAFPVMRDAQGNIRIPKQIDAAAAVAAATAARPGASAMAGRLNGSRL
jgi:hypothetical protein